MNERRFESAIRIGRGCSYWQYVRGDWLGKLSPIQIWEDAARASANNVELFDALVYKLNVCSKQAKYSSSSLLRAISIEKEINSLFKLMRPYKESNDRYLHAISLLDMARGQLAKAETRWKKCLKGKLAPHEKSAMQRWLAVCLLAQKKSKKREEARKILLRHLIFVQKNKFERPALMAHLNLAGMDLEDKQIEPAGTRLREIKERIEGSKDLSYQADHGFYTAKYLLADGQSEAAAQSFQRARSLYEGLGKHARVSEIDLILPRLLSEV